MMSQMATDRTRSPEIKEDFENDATTHLNRIQALIRAVIDAIPGITRRPTDLQRTLEINVSLAWQIHRFARADDAFAEIRNLPGAVAFQRFLDAARARGVAGNEVTALSHAFDAFQELISHHAESRKEFESLLTGLAENGAEQVDLKQRRAAYEAQSHLLGFRADTDLACFIYAPSPTDPHKIDSAVVRTLTGVRRFRRDASIVIASMRSSHEDGSVDNALLAQEPIADGLPVARSSLLAEFCSKPLPILKQVSANADTMNVEMQPQGLGAQSAMTCTIGHCLRGEFDRFRTTKDRHQTNHAHVRNPCKLLIQDSIVYRGLFAPTHPELMVFTDHRDCDRNPANRDCDRLPTRDSAVFMGTGNGAIRIEEVPHYRDLLGYVFDRMHWNIDDFDVWRARIEYPLMPSSVFTQFELAEQPGAE